MNKSDNQKHYFDTVEQNDVPEVLDIQISKEESIQIWAEGNHEKHQHFVPDHRKDLRLYLKYKSSMMSLWKSKLVDQEVFVKVSQTNYHYFTTSILKYAVEQKLYYIDIERDFYRGVQRSSYRLAMSAHMQLKVKLDTTVYEGKDISAGGMSFVIPSNQNSFEKGQIFEDCQIQFMKTKYDVPSIEVASIWEVDSKNTGIGLKFLDLTYDAEVKLHQQVQSEARGEEVRKMLEARKKKKD